MANGRRCPLNIENWPVDKPVRYARNARKLSAQAVEKVAASLREYGFRQPIVVDKKPVR
jgi:ParB-like chromosome segregation protein Spo0J